MLMGIGENSLQLAVR